MKHLKKYENLINDIKIKNLSDAFVEFFNAINTSLNCYYDSYKDGSYHSSQNHVVANDSKSLILLTEHNELIKIVLLDSINDYFSEEELEKIEKFLSMDKSSTYINKNEVDEYIEKLNLNNYKNY